MTAATVDTDATVLDGLDFAHAPPCDAEPCRSDPRPAAWMVRLHQCCTDASPHLVLCDVHVSCARDVQWLLVLLHCLSCGHTMPGRDWVVSVHRIDGGEQR